MPKRPIVCGLLAALVAGSATLAPAQGRRYRDFIPGPALSNEPVINPQHEQIKTQAQQAYRKADYKRAIELASSVLRKVPKDAVASYIRGSARIDLGLRERDAAKVREGIADARNAVVNGAKDQAGAIYYLPYMHGMIGLAKLEKRKEHAEVALQVGSQVLELDNLKGRERANLHFQRAAAFLYLGKHAEAAKEYQATIEIDNTHIGAYVAAADAHATAGDHDAAVAAYDRAVDAFPESSVIRNNRGSYLRSRGRLDDAIADFTQAVELDTEFAVGFINRGYTRMQLGQAVLAEADFTRALEIDPEKKNVFGLRGGARVSQGRLDAALEDYAVLTEAHPKYATGQSDMGFAMFYDGKYDTALEAFNKALELDGGMKYLDTWRFACLIELDRTDEAAEMFSDSLAKPVAKRDWVDRLIVYLNDDMTAEELLATIKVDDEKRADQQRCEAHFVIGRKLMKAGETEAAEEHFAKVLDTSAKYLAAYRAAQFQLGRFAVAEKPVDAIQQ